MHTTTFFVVSRDHLMLMSWPASGNAPQVTWESPDQTEHWESYLGAGGPLHDASRYDSFSRGTSWINSQSLDRCDSPAKGSPSFQKWMNFQKISEWPLTPRPPFSGKYVTICFKNTKLLKKYRKAVRWCASLSAVFVCWLDSFELVYKSFELIGLTLFIWLIDWMNEHNMICPNSYISYLKISCFKLVWSNIAQLKDVWDIWFKLVWYNISWFKVLWDNWFVLVWLNI